MDEQILRERLANAHNFLVEQVKATFGLNDFQKANLRIPHGMLALILIRIEILIESYTDYSRAVEKGQAYAAIAEWLEFDVPEMKDDRQEILNKIRGAFDEFDRMLELTAI